MALAVLHNPRAYHNKRILFRSVYYQPLSRWLSDLAEFSHRPVHLTTVPYEAVQRHHAYAADIFASQQEFGFYPAEADPDIMEASDVVGHALTDWRAYLRRSAWGQRLVLAKEE